MERLPLFEKNFLKKIAEERLAAVSEAINFRTEHEPEPGLLTGLAGQALFLYHYGRTCNSDRHENQAYLTLRRCLYLIDRGFDRPSYAAGLAGIRFTLRYLASRGFISEEEGSALEPAVHYLKDFATERFNAGDYDLLHGALGIYMDPHPLSTLSHFHISISPLIKSLHTLSSHPAPGQVCWPSTNPKTGAPEINLGLAHGIPSILLLLSQLLIHERSEPIGERSEPVRKVELREMVEQGMNYLLSCQMDRSSNGSLFPHRMVNGKPDQPGRLAWCYGDPGVGAAVWQIGANCGREDWQAEGVKILRKAAAREHAKANRIYDACLCHGSAGLALIFYKMALLTGHDEFLDASDHWMRATLDYGITDSGAGGYTYLTTGNRYQSVYSLLEGLAGTGLAILTLMEPEHNLGWEKAIML